MRAGRRLSCFVCYMVVFVVAVGLYFKLRYGVGARLIVGMVFVSPCSLSWRATLE